MGEPPIFTAAKKRAYFRIRQAIAGVSGIWFGCAVVLAVVWGGLAWMIQHESMHLAERQGTEVQLQASGFADYVALHLLLVDRVMFIMRRNYEETGAFPSHRNVVPELGNSSALLHQVAIADRNGSLVASTVGPFKGLSIADRPYFRALAADPTDRLYIGESLVVGKVTGKMSLHLARPLRSADGGFRGVIVASIDPRELRRYFNGSDLFESDGMAVIFGRQDGRVRARLWNDSLTWGESVASSTAWKVFSDEVSGTQIARSVFDGKTRRIAFHQVGNYELAVGVTLPVASFWSLASPHLRLAFAMAAALSMVLILLARERVRLELRQREYVQQLAASRQKELEANQMKSRFLASVSHELRTPLNSILGFSELIRDEASGADTARFAGLIHSSGEHLHALVNTLLDLAKIEAGKMEVERDDVDLNELLETVTQTHRGSIKKKDLTLSLELPPAGPLIVRTDRTKLLQVLNNVLHNAIKFTEFGRVAVSSCPTGDGVLIRVADTGRGIAEEDIARVFSRFNTVGRETEQERGSGLGLALSKSLIGLLGGTITLQSQLGAGTQVEIFLPKGAPQ